MQICLKNECSELFPFLLKMTIQAQSWANSTDRTITLEVIHMAKLRWLVASSFNILFSSSKHLHHSFPLFLWSCLWSVSYFPSVKVCPLAPFAPSCLLLQAPMPGFLQLCFPRPAQISPVPALPLPYGPTPLPSLLNISKRAATFFSYFPHHRPISLALGKLLVSLTNSFLRVVSILLNSRPMVFSPRSFSSQSLEHWVTSLPPVTGCFLGSSAAPSGHFCHFLCPQGLARLKPSSGHFPCLFLWSFP